MISGEIVVPNYFDLTARAEGNGHAADGDAAVGRQRRLNRERRAAAARPLLACESETMAETAAEIVVMRNIAKSFGDLAAIHDASMAIRPGEIHALVGENGAGKTTLMNILYGLLPRDSGEVHAARRAGAFRRAGGSHPQRHRHGAPAFQAGAVLHRRRQHHPRRRAARSGRPPRPQGGGARSAANSAASSASTSIRAPSSGTLPVGLRQRVEILKALYRDAEILILDEPTAVLTPQETRELFATMRSLARSGRVHHLHHPQAARGARRLRPHLGDAPRADHRHERQQGGHRRGDRQPDGRARRPAARRQGRGQADARAAAYGRRARRSPAIAARRRSTTCRFPCGPARSSGSPACRATARTSWSKRSPASAARCRERSRSAARTLRHADPRAARDAGLAYVPADRGRVGLSLLSRIWENLTLGHQREFVARAAARLRRRPPSRRRPDPQLRHPRRRRGHARRLAFGRQPAEGPARSRADPQRAADRCRAAIAGRRHRGDRGDPPHARADARRRPGGLRDLGGPRRGVLHLRPHPRHLSRPDRRRFRRPAQPTSRRSAGLMGGLHEDHTHLERVGNCGPGTAACPLRPQRCRRRLLARQPASAAFRCRWSRSSSRWLSAASWSRSSATIRSRSTGR